MLFVSFSLYAARMASHTISPDPVLSALYVAMSACIGQSAHVGTTEYKLFAHHMESAMIRCMDNPGFRRIVLSSHQKTPAFAETVANVKILSDNDLYRVSDAYRGAVRVVDALKGPEYAQTIMGAYVRAVRTTRAPSLTSLHQAMTAFKTSKRIQTDPNGLYVHFRCGDVCPVPIDTMCARVRQKVNETPGLSKVYVVTAAHYGVARSTCRYKNAILSPHPYESNLKRIVETLETIFVLSQLIAAVTNLRVEIISNRDADVDLCLLSTCDHAVYSGGGFSHVCEQLQSYNPPVTKPPVGVRLAREMFF